jgi:hypothetical protein
VVVRAQSPRRARHRAQRGRERQDRSGHDRHREPRRHRRLDRAQHHDRVGPGLSSAARWCARPPPMWT